MFALKDLITRLGVKNIDGRQDGSTLNPEWGRATYLFNAGIAGIERADALLIIGSNPRREAAVLNARIRKRWRAGKFPIALIGDKVDLTYPYDYLGAGPQTLEDVAGGKHSFAEVLKGAERPLIIIGAGALARPDGGAVAALAAKAAIALGAVKEGWDGFCVLHTAASRVGALELGFVPGEGGLDVTGMTKHGAMDLLFLLGADEVDVPPGAFVVYIGSHGDNGAHRADVILPGAAYPEKSGIYVNTEGRVQMANRATFPPGEAREDWAIIRALSEVLGAKLPYDTLAELRRHLFQRHPHLQRIGQTMPTGPSDIRQLSMLEGYIDRAPFHSPIDDFYLTNPIARASAVMAECSALAEARSAMTAAE
jgi:NADH-quinone oxidoreductase subunit G